MTPVDPSALLPNNKDYFVDLENRGLYVNKNKEEFVMDTID